MQKDRQLKRIARVLTSSVRIKYHYIRISQIFRDYDLRSVFFYIRSKFRNSILSDESSYQLWLKLYETLTASNRNAIKKTIEKFSYQPLITILLSISSGTQANLSKTLDSVCKQLYANWELFICIDDNNVMVHELLKTYLQDSRIKIYVYKEGIPPATAVLPLIEGEFLTLLEPMDVLAEYALFLFVRELNRFPQANLLYSDEDKINAENARMAPMFKSDWNPVLLLSVNYIAHSVLLRTSTIIQAGGLGQNFSVEQSHDLLLRVVEKIPANTIRHIPYILYHRQIACDSGMGATAKSCKQQMQHIIDACLKRRNIKAELLANPNDQDIWRISIISERLPGISIIIPTRDKVEFLQTCVDALLNKTLTDYPEFEIIVVDNQSEESATHEYLAKIKQDVRVKIMSFDKAFNWAEINNVAARAANFEYILLLNNDIEPMHKEWLREMVSYMTMPEVAVVGAKLYFPNNTIQHAGVILGIGGVAHHIMSGTPREESDKTARLFLPQNYSVVTGACMLIRKSIFEAVGGLDERLAVAFNDVDLCMRIVKAGYQVIWTPFAELYHYESATRGSDFAPAKIKRFNAEYAYIRNKHGEDAFIDPFFNRNLSLESLKFELAFPPRRKSIKSLIA
jgi:O-antigen biosynthesis protein